MKKFILSLLVVVLNLQIANAELKYIFYMIGDGMGANQVLAAEMYQAEMEGRIGRKTLNMTGFPYTGQVATFSHNSGITDSAAAGTCLASGQKTDNGHLGTAPNDEKVFSIASKLQEEGWNIGIMTTVTVDHATPGAFYAHVHNRNEYYTVGTQLAESGYAFFGGAGFQKPENPAEWNKPNLYDLVEQKGYTIARGYNQAKEMMGAEKMLLIQEQDGVDKTKKCASLNYVIDRKEGDLSLPQITKTAIDFLSAKGKPFFMMVEGGMIDYAGHADDGATNIRETLEFDEAIGLALQFYREHQDETLIVVTADHETGGMALGNSDYSLNLKALSHQHISSWTLGKTIEAMYHENGKKLKWEEVKNLLREKLDFFDGFEISQEEEAALMAAHKKMISGKGKTTKTLYQDIDELAGYAIRLINKRAKLGWTSYAHTASAVPVFAIGVGAEQFVGWHDNSELAPMIMLARKK